uniref:Integrase catalytic domain-containing protein n=1 Tax=Cyprinus carpio TaxID=7962 RepID=A0A8C1I8T0_CYPCA
MVTDVKRYVISCPVCQLIKPSQRKQAGLMVPIKPMRPWEYTGVDFVGPLPRTQMSAVRSATAQVAASNFLSEIFARHGAATYLISDRGTPFVSNLFEHVVAALGTEHQLTTAYHPQTNATERVNRTLKTAIRAYVEDKHTSWDKYLLQICFSLRTAWHESTGQSPAMLLYGRELDTPLDLITQPNSAGVDEPEVPYHENLRASLKNAHDHARAALSASHTKKKRYYDKKRRTISYAVDDLVRVKTHPKSDAGANFTAKLAPVYDGPFRVSKKLSSVNYRLSNVDTGEDAGVFHVVNLLLFHSRETAMPKITPPLGVCGFPPKMLSLSPSKFSLINHWHGVHTSHNLHALIPAGFSPFIFE